LVVEAQRGAKEWERGVRTKLNQRVLTPHFFFRRTEKSLRWGEVTEKISLNPGGGQQGEPSKQEEQENWGIIGQYRGSSRGTYWNGGDALPQGCKRGRTGYVLKKQRCGQKLFLRPDELGGGGFWIREMITTNR